MPKIQFEVPHGLGLAVATAILARPVSFHPAPGVKSVDADWTHDDLGSEPDTVIVTFPDPKPTIPELIAKWHADQSVENHLALWFALYWSPGREFVSPGGPVYWAESRADVKFIVIG